MPYFSKKHKTVQSMVQKHYIDMADTAQVLAKAPAVPAEGWVRSFRKALGMSGAQLAARMNLSRNRVSVLERREKDREITLNQLKELAQALDCELTYAIVPKQDIETMRRSRAKEVVAARLAANSQHMLLEAQSIDPKKQQFMIEQLTEVLLASSGRLLWNDETAGSDD